MRGSGVELDPAVCSSDHKSHMYVFFHQSLANFADSYLEIITSYGLIGELYVTIIGIHLWALLVSNFEQQSTYGGN